MSRNRYFYRIIFFCCNYLLRNTEIAITDGVPNVIKVIFIELYVSIHAIFYVNGSHKSRDVFVLNVHATWFSSAHSTISNMWLLGIVHIFHSWARHGHTSLLSKLGLFQGHLGKEQCKSFAQSCTIYSSDGERNPLLRMQLLKLYAILC